MGSDITNLSNEEGGGVISLTDPLVGEAYKEGGTEGVKGFLAEFNDPLDLFGLRGAEDIEAEGEAARGRVKDLMSAAETMRQSVLKDIQERDLRASKTTANIRREALLRRGRTSTIL